MTENTRKNIRLRNISWLHTSSVLLAVILLATSLKYIENIVIDTEHLYQTPFKVSTASLSIQLHIQMIQQMTNDLRYVDDSDKIKILRSKLQQYERQVLSEFRLISKLYLGDRDFISNVEQQLINWLEVIEQSFTLTLQQHNNEARLQYVEQQSNEQVIKLQRQIAVITEFTHNKAKVFNDASKANFSHIEKIATLLFLFLLSMQLLLFRLFKRKSIKEKNRVLAALSWSNQLLDSSPDAIIITDHQSNITQVNSSAEKMFGYDKDEFIGLNISELMPQRFVNHQAKVNHFFENSSSRKMGEGRDLFAVKKSGEEFQVEISLNLAELNHNKVAITSIRDVTKQKQIESKVLHQANYDFLTQLPNRLLSFDRLFTAIKHAKRNKAKVAIMFIDLDDFKKANDIFGHKAGDHILISTANRLKSVMRDNDTVGRFGGDEFFILIDNFSSKASLITIADKILEVLKRPLSIGQHTVFVSASIGISIYPDDGDNVEELLVSADLSMYASKKLGKNSFSFFEKSMKDTLNRQSSMEDALKGSLQRNEFHVVYQPKYEMKSNTVVGFEALIRWDNADFIGIGPDDFIPILEQIGLINEVGMFVLDNALKMIKQWRDLTQKPLQVAVNISPVQFTDPLLFQLIQQALTQYDLPGQALEIEITEGVLLEGTKDLKKTLCNMRDADIAIALDDFGTGYASLSYIKDYPINAIKIDRSFVDEINKNKTHTSIVKAVILLAHSLDFHVTAEGIESEEQLDYLKSLQCDIAQGYYLSRPLTADKIIDLLSVYCNSNPC